MDVGASSSGAVGFAHDLGGLHAAAQPVGATPVAGGEKRRHGPSAYSSCLSNSHNSSFAHRASSTSTPTQPQSASPSTARFFVSSPVVAMPNELWSSAEASGVPDGVAEDANVDGILGDEKLDQVFESIGKAEVSGLLESVKRESQGVLQLATKRRLTGRSKP